MVAAALVRMGFAECWATAAAIGCWDLPAPLFHLSDQCCDANWGCIAARGPHHHGPHQCCYAYWACICVSTSLCPAPTPLQISVPPPLQISVTRGRIIPLLCSGACVCCVITNLCYGPSPPQSCDAWLLETCAIMTPIIRAKISGSADYISCPPLPVPSSPQGFDAWLLETCTVVPGEDRQKRLEAWAQAPGGKLVGAGDWGTG